MRIHTAFLGLLVLSTTAHSNPDWWETRGVISTGPAANLAPANIGQAKHMAATALAELQQQLPPDTYQALQTDVARIVDFSLPDPLPPGYQETQRAVLLNGQLKAIAKPFYDHLRTHDATWLDNSMVAGKLMVMEPGTHPPVPSPYPWSEATTDDANRTPATLGQLKAVFSLPLETLSGPTTDTDGDGMPDDWEIQYGLNPSSASDAGLDLDGDGLTNLQEYQSGTKPANPDTDGDGAQDGDESAGNTDPTDPGSAPQEGWIVLTGDQAKEERKAIKRTVTIPKGQTRLVMVALHSEEYPQYTEYDSEFDDVLEWKITPTAGTAIAGQTNVNDKHVDWQFADAEGTTIKNFYPVHIEKVSSLTAPPETDLTVTLELAATNISDGALPSTVMVGLLPVEVVIPKLDSGGNQIDGEFVGATELKVAKWEDAFEGTGTNGSVKDDFIGWDKDRFYVRIPGGASMGIEAVKVATEDCPDASYNDDATRIELTASGSESITDSMILVSDDEDDDYAGSGAGADDQDDDRTHKVQLGGNLVIKSLIINGTEHTVNMKIPVPVRKVLPVDFIRMNVANVHDLTEIERSAKIANERYAQVGIKVNVNIINKEWPVLNPDRGDGILRLFSGDRLVDGHLVGPMTDEYKSFIDQTDASGINIYFLTSAYGTSKGIALTPAQLEYESGEIDNKYFDKAFVNFAAGQLAGDTPAHELGHLLAYKTDDADRDDHNEPYFNLMNSTPRSNVGVLSRKRFNESQQSRMYQHSMLTNPP